MTPPRFRSDPDHLVVTGAGGWLGRALVVDALAAGRTIRALARDDVEAVRLGAWGVPADAIVVGDVVAHATLDALLGELVGTVDVVHAAGVVHPASVDQWWRVNAAGTRVVLAGCRRHGVRRLVHVSSTSPFGSGTHAGDRFRADEPYRPASGYGASKASAELDVLDAIAGGDDVVIVRPPWFYGPYQPRRQTTFLRSVKHGRFPIVAGGRAVRSLAYVGHVVDGVRRGQLVEEPRRRAWWVADAEPYTMATIVDTVAEALRAEGHRVARARVRLPAEVSRLAKWADDRTQRLGRYRQEIHVLGELDDHVACDIGATRDDLGYDPGTSLLDGMRRSVAWCAAAGIEL